METLKNNSDIGQQVKKGNQCSKPYDCPHFLSKGTFWTWGKKSKESMASLLSLGGRNQSLGKPREL